MTIRPLMAATMTVTTCTAGLIRGCIRLQTSQDKTHTANIVTLRYLMVPAPTITIGEVVEALARRSRHRTPPTQATGLRHTPPRLLPAGPTTRLGRKAQKKERSRDDALAHLRKTVRGKRWTGYRLFLINNLRGFF